MRTFVISDIHGNNKLFRKALKKVSLKKIDQLIIIGDLIDRGNDSKGVLDTIFLLKEHGFKVKCLLGNHEQLFLNAVEDDKELNKWLINGGDKTLSSFLTSTTKRIPNKYIDFIKSLELYYETRNFVFAHAAINMKIENPYSDKEVLLWERNPEKHLDRKWLNGRILIHGHNPTNEDEIRKTVENRNAIIGIDNGTFLNKDKHGSQCILQLENFELNFVK